MGDLGKFFYFFVKMYRNNLLYVKLTYFSDYSSLFVNCGEESVGILSIIYNDFPFI